eukprot:COSAG04_NODE_1706_length_5869_cov_15.541421_1_plen_66_part_00
MGFALGDMFLSALLFTNAAAILHEKRFLNKCEPAPPSAAAAVACSLTLGAAAQSGWRRARTRPTR